METIIILLSPQKRKNPDADLRYIIPERIEEISENTIQSNGYDYLKDNTLAIWLSTNSYRKALPKIITLFEQETFLENDISKTVSIYASKQENADLEQCKKIYP